MPTSSPVRITNFAEAFREPSSSSANHADGGGHGENSFEDETDVLSVDDLMMREADGTSPHLTESTATASYVANVEDGPHTQTTFRSRDPPHPLMATRMNWSLRAQSVQMTSSCVPMARSYQRQSMTDATLHHVRTEPIPATGIYFPVWGSGGNIVCIDDTSPPSWSQIAAKHTPCCELASVFRPDVLLIHTKFFFCQFHL
jgi:hypothetical protein